MEVVFWYVGMTIYFSLGLIAIWGAFCVIIVWRRVAQTRFRNEEEQDTFLDEIDLSLATGDFDAAIEVCDGDGRAMSQLALLAMVNRQRGYAKVRSLVADRFQRDVLSDLEYRLSWVYTVIKSAPMVGLLGTVVGMMGAFAKLAAGDSVDPTQLADDISFALVTTACGLAIAIPLVLATASINVRIRKLEDLVASGVSRFLETFKAALSNARSEKG
ncbi:MAG TPA: MotA/TolQ/ExbB proton channel family protein [Thermoguttaceae bacterium]|nr:MotA/TolQ/ExbB proton channel family protein [Thermoguttaceae bacterium]